MAQGRQRRNWPISHIPVLIDEREWQRCRKRWSSGQSVEQIGGDIHGETGW